MLVTIADRTTDVLAANKAPYNEPFKRAFLHGRQREVAAGAPSEVPKKRNGGAV